MLEPQFVYSVIRKSLVLGGVGALIAAFVASAEVAVAIVIGTLVTALNLRTVAWAIGKMLDAGRRGTSAAGWSALLAIKMLILIAVIWVLLAYVNVNAVGFAIGFSLFMPAIGWQMATGKGEEAEKG